MNNNDINNPNVLVKVVLGLKIYLEHLIYSLFVCPFVTVVKVVDIMVFINCL